MSVSTATPTGGDFGADRAGIRARVESAGTSFYWAMRLLPLQRREAMYAVYAFCREVDDVADSNHAPDKKLKDLLEWRHEIAAIYAGSPRSFVGRALAKPVRQFALRAEDFSAVIDGMEMDALADIRAPRLAELDLYCDRVASAVGRLSVRAFGAISPEADLVAHSLGRALQLTNILRDLSEDARRGRLYLPRESLERQGIQSTDPIVVLGHSALPQVCEEVAALADRHFDDARKAMKNCPRRPMRPAAVMRAVYHAILVRLRKRGWRDLELEVHVPSAEKFLLALRYGLI